MKSINDVVKAKLCISCGACCVASSETKATMLEAPNFGMLYPVAPDDSDWGSGVEFDVCPGKGYEIEEMGRALFPDAQNHAMEFGRWNGHWAARSLDDSLLPSASSGGISTAIADHLLSKNVVQGVVVSRTIFKENGPRAAAFIATSKAELISAQGSKYCPVPAVEIVGDIVSFRGRVLFVGTPCQIAGLRLLQKVNPWLREKIPITIGNYCGGFRDLRETDALIKRSGFRPGNVSRFRYRGGGQPGSMLIEDNTGRSAKLPYPNYARMTGIVKYKRCRLCVDATAELADFSCGDAWIPRFLGSGKAWSIVMTRSAQADHVLEDMVNCEKIELSDVALEEIRFSQNDNLRSKKTRQQSRRRLYKLLGVVMPEFDGAYSRKGSGLIFEIRVLCIQVLFGVLEMLGIYSLFAKAIRRYPKQVKKSD